MDDKQKQALVVYLLVTLALGYFAHTQLVTPAKRMRDNLEREVKDLQSRQQAFQALKQKSDEDSRKAAEVKDATDAIMARFPVPKGKAADTGKKNYDEFSISEQISSSAHGMTLTPRDRLEPDHFLFQCSKVEEEDMQQKATAVTDPANGAQFADKAKIFNFLAIDNLRYKYSVSGDYRAVVTFMDSLAKQQVFLNISGLDISQKGNGQNQVQAVLIISALDLSDGLVNPLEEKQ